MTTYANVQDNVDRAGNDYLNVRGKVVLVTGASSGSGAANAALLGRYGAHVAVGFNNNEEGAEAIRAEIRNLGGTACAIRADLLCAPDRKSLVQRTVSLLT